MNAHFNMADAIDLLYGNPMQVISDCLRGFITAAPGKKLVVADFANIEGRGLAWAAGEDWKVAAFEAYDRGEAPDTYIVSYATAFGVPLFSKKDPRRQTGKVMELFSGYQGGHGAYLKGLKRKDLPSLAVSVKEAAGPLEWLETEERYNGSHGLNKDEWTAIRILVDRWRAKHPAIVGYWSDLEAGAIKAVQNERVKINVGPPGRQVTFLKTGSFLFCRLMSGRRLCYPYPRIVNVEMPWRNKDGEAVYRPQLHYKSVDSVTNKWAETNTYGGKLCENVTQALCRDILAAALIKCEARGYSVVMHVHDEIVSEVDEAFGSVNELEDIMSTPLAWTKGFPIAAEGWEGKRYRK